jgi:aldehyde:ferredoxin oxidoreductase
MFGLAGKVLRVDLSTRETVYEPLSEEVARQYLGGRGFAAHILYRELEPGIDPLAAENKMVIAAGVLTGTPTPAGNRTELAAKSPLTGIWGHATFGGRFGRELKRSGFDVVIIQGASESPVYLQLGDGKAELRDASHLWGLETGPAQDSILQEVGKATVLGIGPAGENLVSYASALSELRFAAGRAGMGAVLGSKKLKAVAVQGGSRVEVARRDELLTFTRQVNREIAENDSCGTLTRYGTWNNLTPLQRHGILPSRNFRAGVIDGGERLESEAMVDALLVDRETCPGCPIFCRRVVAMDEPYRVSGRYGGPQYETVAALGSLVMNTAPP